MVWLSRFLQRELQHQRFGPLGEVAWHCRRQTLPLRRSVVPIQYLRAPSRTIVTVDPERFGCVEVLYDNDVLSLASLDYPNQLLVMVLPRHCSSQVPLMKEMFDSIMLSGVRPCPPSTSTSGRKCTPILYCQTARAYSKRFVSASSVSSGSATGVADVSSNTHGPSGRSGGNIVCCA